MKIIKTLSVVLAGSLLVASCTTYGQASAGFAGAAIGSHIGRDIGFLTSGPWHFGGRNAALGSLIGAGVGAALGVGIQSSIENSQERRYENAQRQYQNNRTSTDDYQTSGGANYSSNGSSSSSQNYGGYSGSYSTTGTAVSNSFLTLEQLSYMDGDGDGYMSKGETIEVETYVTNKTNSTLPNVIITLNSTDDNIALSSPLTTTLSPGQKIRYTGRIYCKKAKSGNAANVSVNVNTSGQNVTTNTLPIYMK